MKVALVGPELEENLGLRYLHSSITAAGHECRILNFHSCEQINSISDQIAEWNPDVTGLSMVFTARGREFVSLANLVRSKEYRGKIVAGGHFASFHASYLLNDCPALDFIIHGEGELTIVDLLENLNSPKKVAGLSYRDVAGLVRRTPPRPNPDDLDVLPPPTRTPPFHSYLGFPIANMLGSRGCFGSCTFCSIAAWYRENQGPRFRQRPVSSVVFEMAQLYNRHGVRIFNFHDDTFFDQQESRNIERFCEMELALQSCGLTDIAIQVKARTDAITPEVLKILKRMGLFRVFLGVENHSPAGLRSLGKGTTVEQNRRSLLLLRDANLHATFNLLMFGPDTTVEQLRENAECIREFADMPINFGRVEVYTGTPLERRLRKEGRLNGDHFGYYYEISDPSVQRLFENFRTVFTERNFQSDGMNFTAMKLDYYFQILRHFHPDRVDQNLFLRKRELLQRLNQSNADLLERLCGTAGSKSVSPLLARRREEDGILQREFASCISEIERRARKSRSPATRIPWGAALASAAAALVLATQQQCALDPEREVDTDVDHRYGGQNLLDSTETALVRQRIETQYRNSIDSLGLRTEYANRLLQINLVLTDSGIVDTCTFVAPVPGAFPQFEAGLPEVVKIWTFPGLSRGGSCGITLTVAPPDTGEWHLYEIIAYPHADSLIRFLPEHQTLIEQRIAQGYQSGIDSVAGTVNAMPDTVELYLAVDGAGRVSEARLADSASTEITSFRQSLLAFARTWAFPGLPRSGWCTVEIVSHYGQWHMHEKIAFPWLPPFDKADSTMIDYRITTQYLSDIRSLPEASGFYDTPFTLTMEINSSGEVTGRMIQGISELDFPGLIAAINRLVQDWTFSGVSRSGSFTKTFTLARRVEPHYSEMMAFPPEVQTKNFPRTDESKPDSAM